MKLFKITFLLLSIISSSCEGQEKKECIYLNYTAQTRGFLYLVQLENNSIEINKNNTIQTTLLTETQLIKINSLLSSINFDAIKNNVSISDLAVDSAIKGVLNLTFEGNSYTFDFSHNKLPKEIEELLKKLEEFTN
jgi:hypothetical protein